jgi:hypothetical protein
MHAFMHGFIDGLSWLPSILLNSRNIFAMYSPITKARYTILCSNPTAVFRLCRALSVSSIKKTGEGKKAGHFSCQASQSTRLQPPQNLSTLLEMHVSPSLPNTYTYKYH